MHPSVQSMLDAWEEETDSDDDEDTRKGKRKRDADNAGETWIREDDDVPLDFMSADAAHSVLTLRPNRKRRRETEGGHFQNRADAIRFGAGSGLSIAEDGR